MTQPTLETLRQAAGLTRSELLARFRDVAPDVCPTSVTGVIHWEEQGILDVRVIRGLMKVLDLPFDAVADAAEETKRRYYERRAGNRARPRRQKKLLF